MTQRTGAAERTIFLSGDVMTGRGIDQALPHGGDPTLQEPAVVDANTYVTLAEQVDGPLQRPVDFTWPWGDALAVLDEFTPDIRIVNLETSITVDGEFALGKAVHYRMHPDNVACLTAARPDVCVLANNHILDFGVTGLADTLHTLSAAAIRTVGAGLDAERAKRPAVLPFPDGVGRVVIAAGGMPSSGVPWSWAGTDSRPGIALVSNLSKRSATEIADRVHALKRPGDIAVVSLHWGSNWGYHIDSDMVRFAHRLIDVGIDLVHGHSSHHPRPIEMYRGKLILYGCGDTINDYEGITGYEDYRGELRLLYFATIEQDSGRLVALHMVPLRARRLRLEHASRNDAEWLRGRLEATSRRFGTEFQPDADGIFTVRPT